MHLFSKSLNKIGIFFVNTSHKAPQKGCFFRGALPPDRTGRGGKSSPCVLCALPAPRAGEKRASRRSGSYPRRPDGRADSGWRLQCVLTKKMPRRKLEIFSGFLRFSLFFLLFCNSNFCENKKMPIGILGQGSRNEPFPCYFYGKY